MPLLSRNRVPKLLHQVKGKPHASSDDHEEEEGAGKSEIMSKQRVDKEDIFADPISSDEEIHLRSTSQFPSPLPVGPPSKTSKPAKFAMQPDNPGTSKRKSARQTGIRVPKSGAYENGRVDKTRKGLKDEEKENGRLAPSSSVGKRAVTNEQQDAGIDFGFAYSAPASKRQRVSQTANIHAAPKTFGKQKPFESAASRGMLIGIRNITITLTCSHSVARTATHKANSFNALKEYSTNALPPPKSADDSDSDVSMEPIDEVKFPSPRRKKGQGILKSKDKSSEVNELDPERKGFLAQLAQYRQDRAQTSSQNSASNSNALELITSGANSPQSSMHSAAMCTSKVSEESLEALERYDSNLSPSPSDIPCTSRCPLCDDPVDEGYYTAFWYGKKKTVRQQQIFCSEHTKRDALEKYNQLGYPDIDWIAFPERIKSHHPHLIAIVKNETEKPSQYRQEHAKRATAGERQTVHNMMEDDNVFDSKTGYYGARGRRVMMDAIISSSKLSDVIRDCADDEVVSFGGVANFVQRVLVPELTIALVMEDRGCEEGEAKKVIEDSGSLGMKVHEEIEDTIERRKSNDLVE